MSVALPIYILLAAALILHLRLQWGINAIKPVLVAIVGLFAALFMMVFMGQGGAFEGRYLLDRFSLTLSAGALVAALSVMLLRPPLRSRIESHDLLAIAGIVAATGAQDLLLLFAGITVTIMSLVRVSRHSYASRLFSPPVLAIAALGLGFALIIALAGTTRIVDARISIGVLQVNHRGDIGLILVPALILLFGALALLLAPPGGDHWLRRAIRMETFSDVLLLALWPLIVLVLFARLFVGVLFAFSDPVMTPNDWGIGVSLLLGIMMIAVILAARKENKRDLFLFRAWQFQLLMIPLGLMTITADGLASSMSLALIAAVNTVLLIFAVSTPGKQFSWISLCVAAAMIGFPGVAGFFVRLATLDAAANVSGLKLWLTVLLAIQFSVMAVFCVLLMRHVFASIRASVHSRQSISMENDLSIPKELPGMRSSLVIAVVVAVIIVSSLLTPSLLSALSPSGDMFGLTLK